MMNFKAPKNNDKYEWTQHAVIKMGQYGLSAQRALRVIRAPQRVEQAIVPKMVAVMQPTSIGTKDGKRVWSSEIWVMYAIKGKSQKTSSGKKNARYSSLNTKYKIISVWRYPGVSPERDPIPADILREIDAI